MTAQQPKLVSLLISLASVVLIISGLRTLSGLLAPILLSLFLVLVTAPLLSWLRKRGLPRWLSYLVILLGVGIVGAFLYLFSNDLTQSATRRTAYLQRPDRVAGRKSIGLVRNKRD